MTAVADLPLIASGKVREIYEVGRLAADLASDRISTYDVVHPTPIPDKGNVLTGLSTFWFERTSEIVPNHFVSVTDGVPDEVRGRAMVVRKLRDAPGRVRRPRLSERVGVEGLPTNGSRVRDRAPSRAARVRPAPRADLHAVHEGRASATTRRSTSRGRRVSSVTAPWPSDCATYRSPSIGTPPTTRARAGSSSPTRSSSSVSTTTAQLTLGDEVCTPDSSRFWPADQYEPGRAQPSFDKQFVRDWASSTGWDRNPPAPAIPDDVVARTREKYVEAYERIVGDSFDEWLRRTGAA